MVENKRVHIEFHPKLSIVTQRCDVTSNNKFVCEIIPQNIIVKF
jgi:hypothetical protein